MRLCIEMRKNPFLSTAIICAQELTLERVYTDGIKHFLHTLIADIAIRLDKETEIARTVFHGAAFNFRHVDIVVCDDLK